MKRNTRQAYAYILADSTYRIVRVETSIITLGKIVSPRVYLLSLKFSVDCTNEGCQNLDTAVPVRFQRRQNRVFSLCFRALNYSGTRVSKLCHDLCNVRIATRFKMRRGGFFVDRNLVSKFWHPSLVAVVKAYRARA